MYTGAIAFENATELGVTMASAFEESGQLLQLSIGQQVALPLLLRPSSHTTTTGQATVGLAVGGASATPRSAAAGRSTARLKVALLLQFFNKVRSSQCSALFVFDAVLHLDVIFLHVLDIGKFLGNVFVFFDVVMLPEYSEASPL